MRRTIPLLALLALTACTRGDQATVEGRVTDADGSQFARGLGGDGTIAAASTVEAWTVSESGSTTVAGEADVRADGSYSLSVPAGETRMVLVAVAEDGAVVASAVLEASGEAGETVTATPMDTESSVEAEVFMEMVAQGASDANPIDLRARIDADTAVAVRASTDPDASLIALAEATSAAQATEVEAWADMGLQISQSAMFEAELAASQALSAALHDGEDGDEAHAAFLAALDAALAAESDLDSVDRAEGDAQAGMAFRLVIEGRLSGSDVAWEATHAAAQLEADTYAHTTTALFASADAGTALVDDVRDAGAALESDVAAAASVEAIVSAYAGFQAALVGEATVEGSALGTWLELDAVGAVAMDGAIDAAVTAGATLDATVTSGVDAALSAGDTVDPSAVATAVVDAWASYRTTVVAAVEGTPLPSDDVDVAADVVVLATGDFRAAD